MKPTELLQILAVAEKLKCNTRHCYTSSGRHESVAEHSWRIALMAMLITPEFPEADKLSMKIYSDNTLLNYGKLSEGTKETVSLAFRLAVLDHLFPDGGGVIVFDDPFTDMDAERTAQSCNLIKECATRHQVIFLTCKEEYLNMLEGNRILF